MFTKYPRWKKIGIEIISKLFLVPAKMEKADYRLLLSLITTKTHQGSNGLNDCRFLIRNQRPDDRAQHLPSDKGKELHRLFLSTKFFRIFDCWQQKYIFYGVFKQCTCNKYEYYHKTITIITIMGKVVTRLICFTCYGKWFTLDHVKLNRHIEIPRTKIIIQRKTSK